MDVVDDHKMSETLVTEGVASSPSADEDDHHAATQSTSPSRRAKPALKKYHKAPTDGAAATASAASGEDAKHLKWDEKAIEEHDLLRGTRMKIDEPNTPYTHYDSGAESDDSRRAKSPANQKPTLSWDVLQNRLDSVAAVRDAYPSSPSSHHETDQSDAEQHDDIDDNNDDGVGGGAGGKKDEMRQLEFKEHRKRHYNEMELVRKYRQEHPEGVDVDVDDAADDDNDLDDNRSGDDADNENED